MCVWKVTSSFVFGFNLKPNSRPRLELLYQVSSLKSNLFPSIEVNFFVNQGVMCNDGISTWGHNVLLGEF